MALTKITKTGIGSLPDDVISEEHIDATAITGHTELSATAADDDVLLVFDTSANALKKIQKSNVSLLAPTFSSVSPSNLSSGDGTGNHTIVVTGTKFDASASFKLRTDGGSDIAMDSVTRNSATQLTGTVAKSTANLTNANEPFDIIITNGNGLATTGADALNIDASPAFVTAAGTLGTITGGSAMTTVDIVAADPESAGNVVFDILTGGLPAGLSSATVNENGVSKFRITGTPTNPNANTTTTFTLRASDAASNVSTRQFSLTVTRTLARQSFTSSGTFAVPSGMTSLSAVLVVAGGGQGAAAHGSTGAGGGGAGGLIYMPGVPVTPGGTIAVTVGCGADGPAGSGAPGTRQGSKGSNTVFGASPSPGISAALTAVGGGAGTVGQCSSNPSDQDGGSGGGGGYGRGGGTAQQPTQPGNSGAYGFGSAGGSASQTGPGEGGGGGGGAGAAGGAGGVPAATTGGDGGVGKAYTIGDGTTSVYYAGGGGASAGGTGNSGSGGQGGGTPGDRGSGSQDGTANRGGGSGGNRGAYNAGAGGKGIVIVEY